MDIVLSSNGSSKEEGSHSSVLLDTAPPPVPAVELEREKDPNVNPYGIRDASIARGEERERETVVRRVERLYVGLGRRAAVKEGQEGRISRVYWESVLLRRADTTASKVASKRFPS